MGEIWEIWHFQRQYTKGLIYPNGQKLVWNCSIPYGFRDKWHFKFPPKFKMADKTLEIQLFFTGTISKVSSSTSTQRVQTLLEITLSVRVFEIFNFCQNSRWRPKFAKFNIFSGALHVTSLVPTGFKICTWWESIFGKSLQQMNIYFFFIFTQKFKISHHSWEKCILRRNLRWLPKLAGKQFLIKVVSRLCINPAGQKFHQNCSIPHRFRDKCFCVLWRNS